MIHTRAQFSRQKIWNVLDERSGAVNVQALQAVADAEDGLAHVVGVLQQKFVDGVTARVGGRSARRAGCAKLGGVDVGVAAGQEHSVAALNHFHHFGGRAIERNAHRFAAGERNGAFVLWDRAFCIFAIAGMRHGDGNARRVRRHIQLTLSMAASVLVWR